MQYVLARCNAREEYLFSFPITLDWDTVRQLILQRLPGCAIHTVDSAHSRVAQAIPFDAPFDRLQAFAEQRQHVASPLATAHTLSPSQEVGVATGAVPQTSVNYASRRRAIRAVPDQD